MAMEGSIGPDDDDDCCGFTTRRWLSGCDRRVHGWFIDHPQPFYWPWPRWYTIHDIPSTCCRRCAAGWRSEQYQPGEPVQLVVQNLTIQELSSRLLSAAGASQRDCECWLESGPRPLSSQHSQSTEASAEGARSQRKGLARSIKREMTYGAGGLFPFSLLMRRILSIYCSEFK